MFERVCKIIVSLLMMTTAAIYEFGYGDHKTAVIISGISCVIAYMPHKR